DLAHHTIVLCKGRQHKAVVHRGYHLDGTASASRLRLADGGFTGLASLTCSIRPRISGGIDDDSPTASRGRGIDVAPFDVDHRHEPSPHPKAVRGMKRNTSQFVKRKTGRAHYQPRQHVGGVSVAASKSLLAVALQHPCKLAPSHQRLVSAMALWT